MNILSSHLQQTPGNQIKLITKKISIKFCEFKISNVPEKMIAGETISISTEGLLFQSPTAFQVGTIMRIWIEMPDYWNYKSKYVEYRHTETPQYFQMLARLLVCEEIKKRNTKFHITCENINTDPIDEAVLTEYLSGSNKK